MVKHPRVLGTVRLSILKDDTTSPEKQKHAVEHWASGPAVDGRIVGFAEDLDVSGAMHPFKRPGLGPWFSERADDWDVLAVWNLRAEITAKQRTALVACKRFGGLFMSPNLRLIPRLNAPEGKRVAPRQGLDATPQPSLIPPGALL